MLPEIMQGRCILFLGAGSSANCESPSGGGLTAKGLTREMIKHLGEDAEKFPASSLTEASEFIEACMPRHRDELDTFIYQRLGDLRPTIGHLLLTMFPWRAVVTTNFNQVIERGYEEARARGMTTYSCRPVLTDADLAGLTLTPNEIPLFKPHGCISGRGNHDTPMVLTPKDYYSSIQKRGAIYRHIRELAEKFVTLFVGYSLADYTFNNLYYEIEATLHEYVLQRYAVQRVRPEKLKYMERSCARRQITLIDDLSDTFMLSLADEAGLLTDDICDIAAEDLNRQLNRPELMESVREYGHSIPQRVRDRLSPALTSGAPGSNVEGTAERRNMVRNWDPIAGVFVEDGAPIMPLTDVVVPSLGTSPLYPNTDSPAVNSVPPPEVGS